jgi:two-component system sensor histidine kinase HydH
VLLFDEERRALNWSAIAPDDEVASALRRLEIDVDRAGEFLGRLGSGESQVLRLDDPEDLPGPLRSWVTEVAAEQLVAVPLVSESGVLGVLAVDNRRGGQPIAADEHTLLTGLATQAVIAFENATVVENLRRSRQHVLRADRLGTLGTLAAGLAHEINNPLVAVRTFLTLAPAKRTEEDPEFWDDYLKLTVSEVERISDLVSTMSRLGRGDGEEATKELIDLGELASEVVVLLEREARAANVDLQLERDEDAGTVEGVRAQLHQVVLNLVLNAIEAAGDGGRVVVRLDAERRGGQERVCLSVEDDGAGIEPEHLERIFDPFFTTKEPDRGTGLGLMISHQVVADHGGTIEVRSEPDEGAEFRVRLPMKTLRAV